MKDSDQFCFRFFLNIYCIQRIFWGPHLAACSILVPQPGIEPEPPAVEAWCPNHWTTREFPVINCSIFIFYFFGCVGSLLLCAGFL